MAYDTVLAEIRFGAGLSPRYPAPAGVEDMLARLAGPDEMAGRHPIPGFRTLLPGIDEFAGLARARRRRGGTASDDERETARRHVRTARQNQLDHLNAALRRAMQTRDGLRERLTRFWADHFTVRGRQGVLRFAASPYVEEAIRPNLTGSFAALLKAAVTHEMMLFYLDQHVSVGPSSPAARRGNRGLNENLARELLELHTLGVGAHYTQNDVRELAELLTGLSYRPGSGAAFRPRLAEPGAETVLGVSYGGGDPSLADIHAVLDDLAVHPATAAHLARKLAVHFVADDPDPALVHHVAAAWRESGGDLMASYAALLGHPAAWAPERRKVRQPFDFIAASLRALGVSAARMSQLGPRQNALMFALPMQLMGQPWEAPDGPDGWPEAAAHWVTPQGMAGRIRWAMSVPQLITSRLPDPRAFTDTALGAGNVGEDLRFAARAAETRAEGIGLVLVSPEFQRR